PINKTKAPFSFLKAKVTVKHITAISNVFQSVTDALPISTQTASINAIEATFTVSKKADITLELRSLGTSGLRKATNKNDGRNMPAVAAAAPTGPAICQPTKVAEENTGPGVNCPIAMASINSFLVSKPV